MTYEICGELLKFSSLPSCQSTVYSVGWRILDNHSDTWTSRFNRFKGEHSDQAGINGCIQLLGNGIHTLLKNEGLTAQEVSVTTALSSQAVSHDPNSSLYKAGYHVCASASLAWIPDLLAKDAHEPLHDSKSASERETLVNGKYRCTKNLSTNAVIVIDDFVTRGTTLGEISRAIAASNPGVRVIGLAIAKHERLSFLPGINNNHIPSSWATSF